MSARTGLSTLIETLRAWCNAGTADYSVAGTTYWTDEQLQHVLDRYRADYHRYPLTAVEEINESNEVIYRNYYAPKGFYEEAGGGSAVWTVEDSTGKDVGTASYTANYEAGHIYFTSDTGGSAYYLTARTYDMHRAAADVWRQKAAHFAGRFDWRAGEHQVSASQLYKQALAMAQYYDQIAPVRVVRLSRSDLA